MSLKVRETELPGIGKKILFKLKNGDEITIVARNIGVKDLYIIESGKDEPSFFISLDEEEAKEIGIALIGAEYKASIQPEKLDFIAKELAMEWVKVGEKSTFCGKTIGEMQIRKKTGATIVGIMRGDEFIPGPGPEEKILAGDLLLVIGKMRNIKSFLDYCGEYSTRW